uniref:MTSS1-like protein n=1 Tax=Sinocyclocheilus grahami TaxID=75366 RepID=A0A672RCX9_SINGR
MDAGMEKECSALGGLFQIIMNDMKASYPAWEDFVTKGAKLQSQLRTTIIVTSSFLDAFQKVADIATGTRGATKEIGSALTRMCMRHRSIENKLKLFTTVLMDNLITPLELKIEEWKKVASQLDKDHAKEYKKARAEIKKKSSDTIKLQKKVKKGKGEVRMQLDSALQDVNTRYAVLEETEKRAVCRALIEERGRFCSFVTMLKPFLDEEISMLGEVTHLQTILEDLGNLTADPNTLPPASEQVILDLKGSDYSYSYQTPPASPSNTLSRKSSISREQLALALGGGLNSEAPRTSRDSLHCSSGYSTQTTTPSCSEDTIPSQHAVKKEPPLYDYDYISLHGGEDAHSQSEFDKSSTIPRNSDLSLNYRKMFQSKRPASTVSLLMDPEPIGPHTATIRRKPSSKPNIRRGTISGGVPIPISTPQVPLKASVSTAGLSSEETMCPPGGTQSNRVPGSDLVHTRHSLCTSTQSLSYNHQPQEPQYQQIHQKELQQKHQNQQQIQNMAAHNSSVPTESVQINSAQPGVDHVDGVPDPGRGGDMLSMIRRGVKLRRTLTNDRSAPLITPNHLN